MPHLSPQQARQLVIDRKQIEAVLQDTWQATLQREVFDVINARAWVADLESHLAWLGEMFKYFGNSALPDMYKSGAKSAETYLSAQHVEVLTVDVPDAKRVLGDMAASAGARMVTITDAYLQELKHWKDEAISAGGMSADAWLELAVADVEALGPKFATLKRGFLKLFRDSLNQGRQMSYIITMGLADKSQVLTSQQQTEGKF